MSVSNANAKLANPLSSIPYDQLMREVDVFAQEHGEHYMIFNFNAGANCKSSLEIS